MKWHFCAVWQQEEKTKILVGRIRVKCNLDICIVIFLSALESTIFTYKCLVTCDLLRVTESHCC